jgi:hypothetical protein
MASLIFEEEDEECDLICSVSFEWRSRRRDSCAIKCCAALIGSLTGMVEGEEYDESIDEEEDNGLRCSRMLSHDSRRDEH